MVDVYVIKFGGSVQKTKEDIIANIEYILEKQKQGVVIPVVSAPYKVTDMLKEAVEANDKEQFKDTLARLFSKYIEFSDQKSYEEIHKELHKLEEYFEFRQRALAITAGEDYAGLILRHALEDKGIEAEYFDGFQAGIYSKGKGIIDLEKTLLDNKLENIVSAALARQKIKIIGGYRGRFASYDKDRAVVLPDNSTDATAVIAALAVKKFHKKFYGMEGNVIVEMLKDVPGIKEVNFPGIEAKIAEKLNYEETIEIASNGADVVYPIAVSIARKGEIPIIVKSRTSSGTLISKESGTTSEKPVAAMSVEKRYQISITDPEMIAEPQSVGYAANILSAIASKGIDVRHIPDSAETLTFTVNQKHAKVGNNKLEDELKKNLKHLGLDTEGKKVISKNIYLVSVVGEAMRKPGTLEQIANILKYNSISIKSLAQPEEDVAVPSVTLGINEKDVERAVKELYYGLFEKFRRKPIETLDFPESAV